MPDLSSKKIQNVIFDLGDVLFQWRFQEIVTKLQQEGFTVPSHLSTITHMHPWKEFDRGTFCENTLPDALASHFSPSLTRRFLELSIEHLQVIPEGLRALESCKQKGYRLFVLSNMSIYFRDQLKSQFPIFHHFDGEVFSCDVKYIKPEISIYKHLLEHYGLDPHQCFFVDDREENIKAAKQLNISGMVCDWKGNHFDPHQHLN